MTDQMTLEHSPYLPIDPSILQYNTTYGHYFPFAFNGWQKEVRSWKEGCYLHGGLNPPTPYRITGPDALRLFSDACVNSFGKFSIGASKHAIMCNAQGNIMAHGMLLRTGEDSYDSFFLSPYINYLVDSGKYDVQGEDLTNKVFMFQIAGPRSLEVLEAALDQDLHDLKFLRHRQITLAVDGGPAIDLRVIRIGMSGTLAYEVHGSIADAPAVFDTIHAAGQPFGIERLGMQAYGMNHTENGFPQVHIHFLSAWPQDPDFVAYLGDAWDQYYAPFFTNLQGSAGPDIEKRYCNPVAVGWGHVIKLDHDFVGRAVLEQELSAPRRTVVTLEWNADDILDVYASFLKPGTPHEYMDFPSNPIFAEYGMPSYVDDVRDGGSSIGVSTGRIYSLHYQKMISLGFVETAHAELGKEVQVVWGAPGSNQKVIRATVARFPYLDLPRNEKIDVSTIPHRGTAAPVLEQA